MTLATLLLNQVEGVSKVLFEHSEHTGHPSRIQEDCEPTALLLVSPVRGKVVMDLTGELLCTFYLQWQGLHSYIIVMMLI